MGNDAPPLTIYGTGPLEEWCTTQIEENKLNVEMKGFVPNELVKKIISKSQALILPTLWYEGFPMSIVEAYSAGTPVICSNIGNAGSVVEEGVSGWKFEPGDSKGLVKKVLNWSDISESVKQVYENKYTAEENYKRLLEIYEKVKL